jgi:hypothetical protein
MNDYDDDIDRYNNAVAGTWALITLAGFVGACAITVLGIAVDGVARMVIAL